MKRLKGTDRRSRRQAEGHDDVNTFSVLAAEGFLPGYGLEVGSVVGWAEIPFWRAGAMDFSLPRPPATALREYVPGNLIYANGHRFVARRFRRDLHGAAGAGSRTGGDRADMPYYEVSVQRQAVRETRPGETSSLSGTLLQTMGVCDTDLIHTSHISDEEDLRFQLGVAIYGTELGQHSGGRAFRWGPQRVQLRQGVRLRLVNVGPAGAVERLGQRSATGSSSPGRHANGNAGQEGRRGELGYPVCTVCGQSVSPLSSDRQRKDFRESHAERCGRVPEGIGFHADVTADVLSLPGCDSAATAYSVLEALRIGGAQVLDMHLDDLQVLVIGHVDRDDVDALLWDPMPGGSGLLDQLCERFQEVVQVAREVAGACPGLCESSCIDCLQSFRNAYYHRYLDREAARERIDEWGQQLSFEHELPRQQPDAPPAGDDAVPVNDAETKLRHLLLAAGFGEGVRDEQIRLDHTLGTTTPDVIYRTEDHDPDEGVCIYLDGLSAHLHGNPETAERDREIRTWLRNHGFEVIESPPTTWTTKRRWCATSGGSPATWPCGTYGAESERTVPGFATPRRAERSRRGPACGWLPQGLTCATTPACRWFHWPLPPARSAIRTPSLISPSGSGWKSKPRGRYGPGCSWPKWSDIRWSRPYRTARTVCSQGPLPARARARQ